MIGIIPAAGKGTRFKELGKQYSKTILPYKEKPILVHQIEWLDRHGCDDIRVVVNHQEDSIKQVLKMYNLTNVSLHRQDDQNGLSGAVFSAFKEKENKDCSTLVLLGDLVVTDDLSTHHFDNSFISTKTVPDYSRWCMVNENLGALTFYDKPEVKPPTDQSVSGIYYFKNAKNLYNALKKQLQNPETKINNEFQISTVLAEISSTERMNLVKDVKMIDFGTLEEYLENRNVKNSRSFNDVQMSKTTVFKKSKVEREKIIKEINWFSSLPAEIEIYTPRILEYNMFDEEGAWYKMEKVLSPSLREVYLFLDGSKETWGSIFDSMFDVLKEMESFGYKNNFMHSVYNKTQTRIDNINIPVENKIINEFMEMFSTYIGSYERPSLMHGDFCFSNLLYDFQHNRITMIDPRGEMLGDHYYEVAKIMHSVLFDYDFIDSELYLNMFSNTVIYNQGKEPVKELFLEYLDKYYNKEEQKYIYLICASLFLSMIPLHSHNTTNQKIYFEIFKNIFRDIKEGSGAISIKRQIANTRK